MNKIEELLSISNDTVSSACKILLESNKNDLSGHKFSEKLPKEVKAIVDKTMEKIILDRIIPIGLPILSEESGIINDKKSDLRFIIDPLDGTVNYIRNLGQSSISLALYKGNDPVFGVLGIYPTCDLVWGGKIFGSYLNNEPIKVSSIGKENESILCTGFPSRFQFSNDYHADSFLNKVSNFAKVRMLGSASISLFQIAKGSAEVYSEQEIMLWDVAAGLAIVEGAGGTVFTSSGLYENSLNVIATNSIINHQL